MTVATRYNLYKKGKITKEQFLYEVRKDQTVPFITPLTSFDDAVTMLKQRRIVVENFTPNSTPQSNEDPYMQGFLAAERGEEYQDCPYMQDENPEEYEMWCDGWSDGAAEGGSEGSSIDDFYGDDYEENIANSEMSRHDSEMYMESESGFDAKSEAAKLTPELEEIVDSVLAELAEEAYDEGECDDDASCKRWVIENDVERLELNSFEKVQPIAFAKFDDMSEEGQDLYQECTYVIEDLITKLNNGTLEETNQAPSLREQVKEFVQKAMEGGSSIDEAKEQAREYFSTEKAALNETSVEEGKQPGADKLDQAIRDGKIDIQKVQDATRKAEKGDTQALTDMLLQMSGIIGMPARFNEETALNEDNLEVKSIAKDIYSTLKQNGVNAKLIASIPGTGYAGKSIGATLTGGSNEALVFYWDDTKTKLTTIEIYLSGDKDDVLSFEKKILSSFPGLEQYSRVEYPTPQAFKLNFRVKEKTTAKGGINEAAKPKLGIDQVNPYELKKGTDYEMGYADKAAPSWAEASLMNIAGDFAKAQDKALKNLNKDPMYYTRLQANGGKKEKKEKVVKTVWDGYQLGKMAEDDKANVTNKKEGPVKTPGVKVMKEGIKTSVQKIREFVSAQLKKEVTTGKTGDAQKDRDTLNKINKVTSPEVKKALTNDFNKGKAIDI